ncbi:hypothetical protein LUZ60_004370 [Juncus effusus]|nr:hypothetical protein LUZ60_004370 [Juncus effusus]
MVRGKVQMKRVENPVYRQITFCKRHAGLLKKANELAVLCDAEIGVIVFSDHGKLYESATNGNMQSLIARYKANTSRALGKGGGGNQTQFTEEETMILKNQNNLLQKGIRYMNGGQATSSHMTFDELQVLERMLEDLIPHIRSAKTEILSQQIKMLRDQEGILQTTNLLLQEKMVETNLGFLERPREMILNVPYNPLINL